MFNIVVFLFLVSANGVATDQSVGSLKSHIQFPSEEVCQSYLMSDEGAAMRAIVMDAEPVKNKQLMPQFRCMNMGDPT